MTKKITQMAQLWPRPGRPGTGPMQFEKDWRGVFIRGDDALSAASALGTAINLLVVNPFASEETARIASRLQALRDTLLSCRVRRSGK